MIKSTIKTQLLLLIPIFFGLSFYLQKNHLIALISGCSLSLIFAASNTFYVKKFWKSEESDFFSAFFLSVFIRFFLVILGFIIFIQVIKIDEIYFTVSFIICYLFHSISETISINKFLGKRRT